MSNPSSPFPGTFTIRDFAEKLPFLHPQPTPRSSRDWSRDNTRRTSIGLPTPASSSYENRSKSSYAYRKGHRRQLSLSSFSPRGVLCVALVGLLVFIVLIGSLTFGSLESFGGWKGHTAIIDDGGIIPLGQSRERGGREVFWWEQFDRLNGYYKGRKEVVRGNEWVSEQDYRSTSTEGVGQAHGGTTADIIEPRDAQESLLVDVTADQGFVPCYIDEKSGVLPPRISAFNGLPQGFPAPLFGSHRELGLKGDVCYDRINRFGPYGFGFAEEEGGLGLKLEGDVDGRDSVSPIDYRSIDWRKAQDQCVVSKRYAGPRTAFIIRVWHDFQWTPYHIMTLRAIISELTLTSGGKYIIHFLIHVRDDTIPIWASDEIYNQTLNSSLPTEFSGMGTLWSVAQMKLVYPPPFPESTVNFSGDEIYKAYRSLHFPLQYFAQKHPEFEYFWHWEMDIRVTGGYLELLEQITKWAERQENEFLWEKSAQFFVPDLFDNSYTTYGESIRKEAVATGMTPVSGPQMPASNRTNIPGITDAAPNDITVDLITLSPLFNPERTRWAFHDDITGYPADSRPPTRAALVTATRLSRRLLITMHHETFEKKHTMFPEMFPASIALHYGYKAVYAPLPIYFDRDWPAIHANEIFNNAVVGEEGRKTGMDHGAGHFHGEGGSVFGPGEHVFRGASWYSNAGFAGYLWRRWLGKENGNDEIAWENGRGRMCLPMMVLHPIKSE